MMIVSSPRKLIHRAVRAGLVKLRQCVMWRLVRRAEGGKLSRGTCLPDEVSEWIKRDRKGN
jgi:hypothetical protein